jgi:hypothetical protein
MKKFFTFLTICSALLITSCKSVQKISEYGSGINVNKVITIKPDTLNSVQMDSVINTDQLPVLIKWTSSSLKDEETLQSNTIRTLYDRNTNTIYTVKTLNVTTYILSKRKIQTSK